MPEGAAAAGARSEQVTVQEQRLRIAVALLGLVSAGFAVFYLANGLFGDSEYPFVANSVTKDALLAVLCAVGFADIRRHSWTVPVLIGAHALLAAANLAMATVGHIDDISGTLSGPGLGAHATAWVWIGADIAILAIFSLLYRAAQRARYDLRYLGSAEYRTLAALAEVLVGGKEPPVAPETIAKYVDEYLDKFRAYGKGKIRLALFALAIYPLFSLHPPFSMMSPEVRRRFVERRFIRAVEKRMTFALKRMVVQSLIRAAQQMVFLGYYSQPEVAKSIGYLPFTQRSPEAKQRAEQARSTRDHRALQCIPPSQLDGDRMSADIVIIGSGAAGATLAYELLQRHPERKVVLLERGEHVDRADFSEDESHQLAKLYVDGALTMTRDFRFQCAQGMCVGGSTVINNAVCFDIPEHILARWVDPDGLDSGLDPDRVRAAFRAMRAWLPVARPISADSSPDTLNPSWPKFVKGIEKLGLNRPPHNFDEVDCNIGDCLGSGYCNLGCPYGKKLSMLDNTLPRAQHDFPDRLRIVTQCRAVKIEHDGRRASGVICKLTPEGESERTLRVSAKTVISSAGAIASSVLLARSGIGTDTGLVGRRLAFNMGSPITGDFDDELHSERGLQISHVLQSPPEQGMALELWFNPVVAQSLFMPGWFEDHYRNMQRYAHMMSIGAVVGTAGNARVKPTLFGTRGVSFDYVPTRGDMSRLIDALKVGGKIMLAAGARRVMPSTFELHEFTDERQLDALDRYVRDDSDISVNSAHPQGGNCMSREPAKGVVDPHFRVHGFSNVYVCDASVFPSSITVNPQLTVMALAHYAAGEIE